MAFNSEIKGYMTFGKSFSRGGAFPLEAYEIWTDYDALVAYAANTDPSKDPSYIGQKVAYVDLEHNKVIHYGIEIDGTLKELGAVPTGDGKSISVDANGAISLLGVNDADSLTLPRMKEDKSGIEWVPVSAVVQGDGNDNTTYTFTPVTKGEGGSAETYGFIVKTFFNGVPVEGGEFTIGFDVYTKSEVNAAIDAAIKEVADRVGIPAEDDDSTATLYERIAAEVTRATTAEDALSDKIGVAKNGEAAATGVYAYIDGVINALVEGVDPDKVDSLNELIAWVEAHPDIVSGLDERLVSVENILDGIGSEGEKATVKDYVDDAITEHSENADTKYATKQEITDAGYAIATEVTEQLNKKIESATIAHTSDSVAEGATVDGTTLNIVIDTYKKYETYTKGEVDTAITNKIKDMTGGESARDVMLELRDYKKANDTEVYGAEKVASWTDSEGNYTPVYTQDSRIDTLTTDVIAAQAQANKGVSDAASAKVIADQNKIDLGTLQANFDNIVTKVDTGLVAKVSALEAKDTELAGLITGLDTAVKGHTTTLTEQSSKLTALENEDTRLAALIQANTDKFANYSDTNTMNKAIDDKIAAIPAVDFTGYATEEWVTELGYAKAADVYTKTEADLAFMTEPKVDARINALISASDPDGDGNVITNIQNLVEYVENNAGEIAALVTATNTNTNKLTGIEGTVKDYVDDSITAIIQPKASGEITVAEDGTLGLGEVSTDKFVMGTNPLVLDGGSATEVVYARPNTDA